MLGIRNCLTCFKKEEHLKNKSVDIAAGELGWDAILITVKIKLTIIIITTFQILSLAF